MHEYLPNRFTCCNSKRLKLSYKFCPECGEPIPWHETTETLDERKRLEKYKGLMGFADAIDRNSDRLEKELVDRVVTGKAGWDEREKTAAHIRSRRKMASSMRKTTEERYGRKSET